MRTSPSKQARGFTLIEAVLAIALLAIGVVSLLVIRDRAVHGARKTRLYQAAQRLAYDLAAQVEAGVFGEPRVGELQMGIFVDNRGGHRSLQTRDRSRTEYPAYPENEAEPSYPPRLKFEWEVTTQGQPAEYLPEMFKETDTKTADRYRKRQEHYDDVQRELDYLDPTQAASAGDTSDPSLQEEEIPDEEKTEEWRTLTVFVRTDTADQKDLLLFELQRDFLWTYPDRIKNAGEEDPGLEDEG